MLVLSLMLWKAETLVRLGLSGRVYYLVLLPLGLSAAAFLFGSLRSYAVFTGKHMGGAIELGGPVVGFALTVAGGFFLAPDPSTFPLTVFVHGEQSQNEVILRRSGRVMIDLGGDRRSEDIGDKGQAFFPGVPANFRGQEVSVSLDATGYETVKPGEKLKIDGSSVYLPIRPKTGRISGRVQDGNGTPLAGVAIDLEGLSAKSDNAGRFEVTIPGMRMKGEFSLQATASGYAASRTMVVPGGNDVVVVLHHQP
jgi:hypothetical protein